MDIPINISLAYSSSIQQQSPHQRTLPVIYMPNDNESSLALSSGFVCRPESGYIKTFTLNFGLRRYCGFRELQLFGLLF